MTQISVLTSTKFATCKSLLVMTSSSPREMFSFSLHQQTKDRSILSTCNTYHVNPRGKCSKDTVGIWSLFLAVVSISCYGEGKQFTSTSMITLFSNLPGQYLKAGTGRRSWLLLTQLWFWILKHWNATVWWGCTCRIQHCGSEVISDFHTISFMGEKNSTLRTDSSWSGLQLQTILFKWNQQQKSWNNSYNYCWNTTKCRQSLLLPIWELINGLGHL